MQGSINHQLNNGRLISLPVPIYGVTYAVLENEEMVCVFFGMKTPGRMSAQDILDMCRKLGPGLPWEIYACAETGSTSGSPHIFEQYTLRKKKDRLVLDAQDCGDMVTAFQQLGTDQSPGALAVADIEKAISILLRPPALEAPK
jgi:hypothetical protein